MRIAPRPALLVGATVLACTGLVPSALPASAGVAPCPVPAGMNLITGTPAGERLVGTPGPDLIDGLGGADTVLGRGGDDILLGGDGADRLVGGDGDDCLAGGRGDDRLDIGAGKDTAYGEGGDDWVVIEMRSEGFDHVHGGPGADDVVEWWFDPPFDHDGTETQRGWYSG